jgi:hypothetical protein
VAAARRPSSFLRRNRGDRGLTALERLISMTLIIVAIQMLHPGISVFFARGQPGEIYNPADQSGGHAFYLERTV